MLAPAIEKQGWGWVPWKQDQASAASPDEAEEASEGACPGEAAEGPPSYVAVEPVLAHAAGPARHERRLGPEHSQLLQLALVEVSHRPLPFAQTWGCVADILHRHRIGLERGVVSQCRWCLQWAGRTHDGAMEGNEARGRHTCEHQQREARANDRGDVRLEHPNG